MKKFIILLFTTLFILNLNAQQWAKQYTGADGPQSTDFYNSIYNTAYDSQGNIYILGTFGGGATYDGEALLDYFPHSNNSQSLLIAKLDQNGNMLWRKAIKNGQGNNVFPANSMQLIGDTSLAFAVTVMDLAGYNTQDYLFYLDTLVQVPNGEGYIPEYPFSPGGGMGSALITLDLDGNLLNQNFLELLYLDSNNEEISLGGYPFIRYLINLTGAFHIDKDGNIYIYTGTSKYVNGIYADKLKIRVDKERDLNPFDMSLNDNAKLFKFSPNFAEMIWSKDLIIDTLSYREDSIYITPTARGIAVDSSGDIYITGYINTFRYSYGDSTCYIYAIVDTNNPSHNIRIAPKDEYTGFIVKYNSDGEVMWTNQLYGRQEGDLSQFGFSDFSNVLISEENNAAYVLGLSGFLNPVTNLYFEDSIPLRKYCDTSYSSLFFAKFNKETGSYISHGIAPSPYGTGDGNNYNVNNSSITVKNNQVFAQTVYTKYLMGIDTMFTSINPDYWILARGLAFIRWKDNGYIIDVKDFPINCDYAKLQCRNTVVNDNGDMILTGMFNNSIDFGDIQLTSGGNSTAYIAKFNDPSFLVPFVGGDTLNDRQPQSLNDFSIQKENEIIVYPNPTKDEVYIRTKGEQINSYYLYNINGQVLLKYEKVKTNSQKLNLSAFTKGVYVLKVVTDKNVYSRKVVKN
ncbi:MAG: T9SS type A sorting domain-containing protein [Bacteroidales bacterium]|nr:T9SS type A sorting domain-containing protein [Bacteroidales bacterium]